MRSFLIDKNTGDLVFSSQQVLEMVDGIEEKRQALWLLFTTAVGEWFLDTRHGVDYHGGVLGRKPDVDEQVIRAAVEEALSQELRVSEVLSITTEFDRVQRHLEIRFRVIMEGEIVEEVVEVG